MAPCKSINTSKEPRWINTVVGCIFSVVSPVQYRGYIITSLKDIQGYFQVSERNGDILFLSEAWGIGTLISKLYCT